MKDVLRKIEKEYGLEDGELDRFNPFNFGQVEEFKYIDVQWKLVVEGYEDLPESSKETVRSFISRDIEMCEDFEGSLSVSVDK